MFSLALTKMEFGVMMFSLLLEKMESGVGQAARATNDT